MSARSRGSATSIVIAFSSLPRPGTGRDSRSRSRYERSTAAPRGAWSRTGAGRLGPLANWSGSVENGRVGTTLLAKDGADLGDLVGPTCAQPQQHADAEHKPDEGH